MKIFIFSRRFLFPFFAIWLSHSAYLAWELWQLYKSDFEGKGLPASLKYKWLWLQISGDIMVITLLLAFLIGTTFYAHYRMKKDESAGSFFFRQNLVVVAAIAIAGFLLTSFYVPGNNKESLKLLTAIIYAPSYEEFKPEEDNFTDGYVNERMLNLPELYKAKNSLLTENNKGTENYRFSELRDKMRDKMRKRISFQIARKTVFPISIVLFYMMGILLVIYLYRIHVIFSLLIAYFLIFPLFYYGEKVFEVWHKTDKAGLFLGANGMTVVLGIVVAGWLLILKRKGRLKHLRDNPNSEI